MAQRNVALDSQWFIALTSKPLESEVRRIWPTFEEQISTHISVLDGTVKHLSEIRNFSPANRERIRKNLVAQNQLTSEPDESAKFPVQMLPSRRRIKFYGRQAELEKINNALDWRISSNSELRTYTIYGRRGVGKTELALEYAYKNPARFDAIFWVGCETSLILRQSFTDMAKAVNLAGADTPGMRKFGHMARNN